VFAGPSSVSGLFTRTGLEGVVGCRRLTTATDLGNHQSLIGRTATDPIRLSVSASRGSDGSLEITISVTNPTLGTVPLLYSPEQVLIGDDGSSSGLGFTFSPPVSLNNGGIRPGSVQTFNEAHIRLLGPRQRCIHTERFTVEQLFNSPLNGGTIQVQAYYRISTVGQVLQTPGVVATPIYIDQGFKAAVVLSAFAPVPGLAPAS